MSTKEIIVKLKKFRFFSDFFTGQFVKYIIIGFLSALTYLLLIFVLTDYIKMWVYYSMTIGYITVFWLNFLLSKYWAFRANQVNSILKQLTFYTPLFIFNLCAFFIIVYILKDIFGIHYLISNLICNGVIAVWNFLLYKKVIYK